MTESIAKCLHVYMMKNWFGYEYTGIFHYLGAWPVECEEFDVSSDMLYDKAIRKKCPQGFLFQINEGDLLNMRKRIDTCLKQERIPYREISDDPRYRWK